MILLFGAIYQRLSKKKLFHCIILCKQVVIVLPQIILCGKHCHLSDSLFFHIIYDIKVCMQTIYCELFLVISRFSSVKCHLPYSFGHAAQRKPGLLYPVYL